jgi:hypothetical protein
LPSDYPASSFRQDDGNKSPFFLRKSHKLYYKEKKEWINQVNPVFFEAKECILAGFPGRRERKRDAALVGWLEIFGIQLTPWVFSPG